MKESTARKSLFETTRETPMCTSRWPRAAALLPLGVRRSGVRIPAVRPPTRTSSARLFYSLTAFVGFEMTKNTTDNINLQYVYLIAKIQNKK